ncbi:MAG: hypothetical protein KQH53_06745 [Desulfarculaceae bacterium]|nr:hypothetical protein [Desulfarculaceae bacterium]
MKEIQYAQIEDFLLAQKVGDKTRHNMRSHLLGFFKWLNLREKDIPVPRMPKVSFELGWRNIIDLKLQARILETVEELTWKRNPRIWLGIKWLATYVAIRPGEMRNLRERDIDVNGFFVVIKPKEKKPKLIPMLDEDIELYRGLPTPFPDLPFFRHLARTGAAPPRPWGPFSPAMSSAKAGPCTQPTRPLSATCSTRPSPAGASMRPPISCVGLTAVWQNPTNYLKILCPTPVQIRPTAPHIEPKSGAGH